MKMRLQTRRDVIRNAAARWRQTYTWGGKFSGPYPWGDPKAIYDKLISLNLETCSKAELEAVYNGLALNRCDECGNDREVLVRFGPEPDYEEGPFDICPTCLKRAIALIG